MDKWVLEGKKEILKNLEVKKKPQNPFNPVSSSMQTAGIKEKIICS